MLKQNINCEYSKQSLTSLNDHHCLNIEEFSLRMRQQSTQIISINFNLKLDFLAHNFPNEFIANAQNKNQQPQNCFEF